MRIEPKPVKKKATRKRAARRDEDSDYEERTGGTRKKAAGKKTGRRRGVSSAGHNPLLKYFGDLGIDAVSDSEESQKELPNGTNVLPSSDEDADGEQEDDGTPEQEALPRTFAIVLENMKARAAAGNTPSTPDAEPRPPADPEPELSPSPRRPPKRKWQPRKSKPLPPSKRARFETSPSAPPAPPSHPPTEDDESLTEPEPELPPQSSPVSRPALAGGGAEDESVTEPEEEPAPRPKQQDADDGSETVPESEAEQAQTKVQAVDEESLTEPEEIEASQADAGQGSDGESSGDDDGFGQRPSFPLKPGQAPLGPHVLSTSHVHVPSAVADGGPADPHDHFARAPHAVQIPASANTYLRAYQRAGVEALFRWYAAGRGGCLGDDMGLGKTVQIACFLGAIMQKTGTYRDLHRRHKHVSALQDAVLRQRPRGGARAPVRDWEKALPRADARWPTALVVVPSTLVGNWEREFDAWGFFEVVTFAASVKPEMREAALKDFRMGRADILLTTHELARDLIERFEALAISVVIVDEAHKVKDPARKITRAFHRFACKRRVALTGTAIQNNFDELWALLDWTCPGALGTRKQWQAYVSHPLTRAQSRSASADEKLRGIAVSKILVEQVLPQFFLRRTKDLLRDQLPRKTDEVVFCPLTPTQTAVYRRIIESAPVQNLVRKDEPCDCGSRKRRAQCCHRFDKADLFRYMSTLIKVSNHLALILPAPTDTPEQLARNRALSKLAFGADRVPGYGAAMLEPQFCGKWLVLQLLLREWRRDAANKVLVFTKSVKLLEMLEFHLDAEGIGFVKLDGSTKQTDRMPLIDTFHEDPDIFVFLISTLAGGTGLNLTGANKVVIFDPNWNPAHDLQAMDRAYRIGQTRDVAVCRLLGAGSLEELIYARQVYKQQQMAVGYTASAQTRYFEGVQGDKSRQGELFGIKNIFGLAEGEVRTKMAIEKATLADLDWALANMEAKAKQPAAKKKDDWVYEAEQKGKKEDGDLHGLGALLFDDDAPAIDDRDNEISKTLRDVGITYTHRNENLIANNRIEGEKIKALMEGKKKARKEEKAAKQAKGKGKAAPKKDDDWPPKKGPRKSSAERPMNRLLQRRAALVGLGMISEWDGVHKFAGEFLKMGQEQQEDILRKLDEWAKENASTATASRSRI
ncbi:P-loop containing nucleoside triphosphate hydrolase protein [Phanerochaete sordida]|uniref:P-loop containing nucleoside triphosphate hydrolase protein n=1 Tax=Phanerochaete sordida TaxID=48140 RepID=A0A9P3GT01_9APHY|nr:P-loop containing nucleoside triphosphate hydrolase protein [Phanerochaete sordida]